VDNEEGSCKIDLVALTDMEPWTRVILSTAIFRNSIFGPLAYLTPKSVCLMRQSA
jgi:hypothetical protein